MPRRDAEIAEKIINALLYCKRLTFVCGARIFGRRKCQVQSIPLVAVDRLWFIRRSRYVPQPRVASKTRTLRDGRDYELTLKALYNLARYQKGIIAWRRAYG